jgi:hypothetical protein
MAVLTQIVHWFLLILSIIRWIVLVWVILSWILFFASQTSSRA